MVDDRPTRAAALSLALLLATSQTAPAQLKIVEPASTGKFSVEDWNARELKEGFSFRISVDESQLNDRELREHLQSQGYRTKAGKVVDTFVFSKEQDLFIGAAGESNKLALSLVHRSDGERHFVVQLRDKTTGAFRVLRPEDLAVLSLNGKRRGFKLRQLSEVPAIRVSLALLLDRSGSMVGSLSDAVSALEQFARKLPANAECMAVSFNKTYVDHTSGFADCKRAVQSLRPLSAEGGTDLFSPLLYAFDRLKKLPEQLRLVVMVTDGNDRGDLSLRDVAKRKSAPLAVVWRGWWSDSHLKGLADIYLKGSADFDEVVGKFLGGLDAAVNGQFVISIPDDPAVLGPSQ